MGQAASQSVVSSPATPAQCPIDHSATKAAPAKCPISHDKPATSSSSAAPADTDERPRTPEPAERDEPEVPRTPPPKRAHLSAGGGNRPGGGLPEISPNPFPGPVPTPETYAAHIYGKIEVRNPPLPPRTSGDGVPGGSGSGGTEGGGASGQGNQGGVPAGAGAVTVLAVRKKRKPAPA